MQAHIKFRVAKSKAAEIILIVLAFFVTAPLLFIIYYIFQHIIKDAKMQYDDVEGQKIK